MNWKLTQPNLRRHPHTLMPTTSAIGPNIYLRNIDFHKMLLVALVIHAIVLSVANLIPEQKITNIPVHSLSFKIGQNDRIQAFTPPPAPAPQPARFIPEVKEAPKPVKKESAPAPAPKPAAKKTTPSPQWKPATSEQSVVKTDAKKAAVESVEAKPLPAPVVAPPPANRQMPQENAAEIKKESSLLDFLMLPLERMSGNKPDSPAIADTPQQYVREVGAAPIDTLREQARETFTGADTVTAVGGQGAGGDGTSLTAEQQIRANYEKVISSWIQQHKIYPASARGREGRVVLRVRIDRQGYVRYYALEESSGVAVLNSAAIDMIRRANPVPAVPENYPAGNLIEFLIPITFEAP